MTLHDFFLGGSALRVAIFAVGIAYCIKRGRARSLWTLALFASILVLGLLVSSREWATFLGIPVSVLIVERLTEGVALEQENGRLWGLIEDQHAITEQLVSQLTEHHHT